MPCHPRRRVHLEELPRPVGAENQVEPAPAGGADEQERLQGLRLNRALGRVGDAARAVVARLVGKILVVVIVIALRRLDPGQRQRAIIEDRRGELDAVNELLGQHEVVVLCRVAIGDRQLVVIHRSHFREPDRRAFPRGLDDHGQAQLGNNGPPVGLRVDHAIARRRNAAGEPHQLGSPLVHGEGGAHHPAPRVRDAQHFQRALHRAVLAEAAVQGDEGATEALRFQLVERAFRRIERMRVDAPALQGSEHGVARHERDLALRAGAAHQHRYLAELAHWTPTLATRDGPAALMQLLQ